ncbi:MAG: MFS transporter [Bacillota bacterium]
MQESIAIESSPKDLAVSKAGRHLAAYYVVEGLTSAAATLLIVGVFFYTEDQFGWGLQQNFLLATVQGMVYAVGALLAAVLTRRFGRRHTLVVAYLAMALVAAGGLLTHSRTLVTAALLAYSFVVAITWPALESLVSSSTDDPQVMSRRLGIYNLVWAGTAVMALAVNGAIIQYYPPGVFLIPLIVHTLCSGIIGWTAGQSAGNAAEASPAAAEHPLAPAATLLAQRRLALWLSRLALPATYMVIYSLAALMPLLPAMEHLSTSTKTLVGSTWMAGRWIAFYVLGITTYWHSRPRLLLWGACAMLVAFLGTIIRPSDLLGTAQISPAIDLAAMIAWQGVLGAALGLIYAGSLYFGMVLSQGSTEHGGYHEALIGLGSVLGPGVGVLALSMSQGNIRVGLAGVAGIVGASVLAAGIASIRLRSSD